MEKKAYRVFVSRYYISTCFFDVEAESPKKARRVARSAAYKLKNGEKVRAEATDNGWIPDDATELPHIGSAASDMKMREFHRNASGIAYIPETEDI